MPYPTIFDDARRIEIRYKVGSFDDGRPRYANAPFYVLKIRSNPDSSMETYICTSYPFAETPGALFGEDNPATGLSDRDGLGWLQGHWDTEEHICGTGLEDNILSQHKLAPL